MEPSLRPDLSRIVARPWLQQPRAATSQLAQGLTVAGATRPVHFLAAAPHATSPSPAEPGFDLQQAREVSERLRQVLGDPAQRRGLHRLTPEPVRTLLYGNGTP